MKKHFKTVSLVLTVFCSHYLNAQSQSTQADIARNKLLDSICYCINKTEIGSIKNAADASKLLSGCIKHNMSLLGDYSNAIGIDWEKVTREKLRELTTNVASEVFKNCPAINALVNRVNVPVDTAKSTLLKNRLTDSICLCISKTDTNNVNDIKDAQIMLTKCIVENEALLDEYAKSNVTDLSKDSNSQDFANSIAAEVYRKCAAMKVMIERVQSKSK